jgi:hypothetical protein
VAIGPVDLGCYRKLLGNGPHESRELTCNGYGDDVRMFASCHKLSVSFAQPDLGLPADVLDHLGLVFESPLQMSADLGGLAVCPGAFHQSPAGMGVTGFGQRTLLAPLTRGIL